MAAIRVLRSGWVSAATLALWALAGPAHAAAPTVVPDFSGYWFRAEPGRTRVLHPPAAGPGPVVSIPGNSEFDIGDTNNAILKPHAAAAVKAHGDSGRAGRLVLSPWALCRPSGVPLILLLGEPVQILQTPEQVTILYERNMQVRRIYLNRPHTANARPSSYGESVGHYEGGTLVIDTIGLDGKMPVDKYGTPHSPRLHVVERYTLMPDRQSFNVELHVEDAETFTTAWSALGRYERTTGPLIESACGENNKDAATGRDYPIPVAERADF